MAQQTNEADAPLARRLADLARYANDLVVITDIDQRILEANDRATSILGYSRDELLRLKVQDLRDPSTVGDVAARVQEQRVAGGAVFETRFRRPDASTFPVEVSVRVIELDGRTFHHATIRDITERRRADEQRVFQVSLLDTLYDAVVGLDPALRVRSWNKAAERLFGATPQEVAGLDLLRVLTPHSPWADRDALLAALQAKGRLSLTLMRRRADGSLAEAECETTTLKDASGAVTGYVMALRDLAERRSAEAALRASDAKFRAAFHGASMGILLIDKGGRLLEHNRAFRELLGFTAEELEGRTLDSLLHPEDLERAREVIREYLEGRREQVVGERRFRRKDGGWAQTIVHATVVRDAEGQFQYSVGVVEDVAQKRALEATLLFADRMSSLGTLAAGVAHEINNPLAFMVANVTYVLEELSRQEPRRSELITALLETQEGASRVRQIVRDLKTFSRPDECVDETADVREAVRSAASLAQNEIRHRAQLSLDLREVPRVAGGLSRLGQVFLNLLVNAAQAITEGRAGENRIGVVTRRAADGRVCVEVSDTGAGMTEAVKARIFEPFFTTKPVGVGTGLGLSICHGIVTGLGGEIEVETRPGVGTTFRVLLPAAPAEATAPADALPAPAPARGRVLVVDDEPMLGKAVARALSMHEVVAVTSAAEALATLERRAFDVVLCDLMMPQMTGMELYEHLARTAPAMSERMIFLTGGAFTPRAVAFLASVPNLRIEKPFATASLQALVAGCLTR